MGFPGRAASRTALWPGMFLLAVVAPLHGQKGLDLREEQCSRQLEQGLRLHHQQQYSQAVEPLRALLQRCPDRSEARLLLGRCLLDLGSPAEAAREFERYCQEEPGNGEGLRQWALALSRLGRFGEAAEICRRGLADASVPATERDALAEALEAHERLQGLSRRDQEASARWSLGALVNSSCNDYMPAVSVDGQKLYFTSNRPGGLGECGVPERCLEDFWLSRSTGSGWSPSRNPGSPLNTVFSEGSGSFTATGTTLYFAACDRDDGLGDCDLYRMDLGADGWSPPVNLGPAVNSPWWDSHPAVSASGDRLVFSSNRPGGFGESDLWQCRWTSNGWSTPENLGQRVNTSGREETPFLHAGGSSLYYSSSGHPGFGDLDLFLSRRTGSRWESPLNLGRPINGQGPDLGLVMANDSRQGIYASRAEGRTDMDLYGCRLPPDCQPDPARLLRGLVGSRVSGLPLQARVRADGLLDPTAIPLQWSDADGAFGFVLPPGPVLISASAPGHFFASRLLEHAESWRDSVLVLQLEPLRAGARCVLDNLLFDFDLATLKPESRPVLEATHMLLLDNPGLVLELQGHTDAVGTPAYNLDLSRRRASSVCDWLLAAGIDPLRLQAKGYGEEQPVADNGTDSGRALNRRTEILVLSY